MSECTHDCSSCGESCASREPQSLLKAHHADAHVGKVYGIVSGKGGVGKSMVTSQLAVTMRRRGYQVGILDADITGPSIPKAFGIHDRAMGTENALIPSVSKTGIQVMSINLLLENETDPVIWRGPVISGVVQQFWTDVLWNCDYLFVDMPPGTGDVSLSVFQSIPLDGIIIVASPQDLVGMVVEKAVKMAEMMNVPIVGLVENMSFLRVKDIEIGYTLPKSWVRQIGLSNIRLYAKGSNLFTFSKFDLWDPEVDTSVGTKYPIMKSFSAGFDINF